jgi:hypothetical protein
MPRIAVCLNIADHDKPRFSGENDYLDYCRQCYAEADEQAIADAYGLPLEAVDKIGDEHPQYAGEDYKCQQCWKLLTARDD